MGVALSGQRRRDLEAVVTMLSKSFQLGSRVSIFTWHPNKKVKEELKVKIIPTVTIPSIIFQSDCCLGRSHWSKEALKVSPFRIDAGTAATRRSGRAAAFCARAAPGWMMISGDLVGE